MQLLLIVTTVMALTAVVLALLALRANRLLRRALVELAEAPGQATPAFRRRWLPRFGLKAMLVVMTVLAIVLGTFGTELMRARRQAEVIDKLYATDIYSTDVTAHYRLGWLGNGKLAALACDWIHSDFGCRVDQLQVLAADDYEDEPESTTSADFEGIRALKHLEALQLGGLSLAPELLEAVVSLPKLKRLSLRNCRLPSGALHRLIQLPLLEDLELTACHLIDEDLEGLEPAQRLSRLVLSRNELTDVSLAALGRMATLRELNLESNNISGTELRHIADLPHLEILSLAYNTLTTAHLEPLSKSPSIRTIYLYRTSGPHYPLPPRKEVAVFFRETPRIVVEWEDAPLLKEWDVSSNRPYYPTNGPSGGIRPGSGVDSRGGGSF